MNFENIEFSSIDFESTGHREGIGDEPIQVGIAIMSGFNIDKKSFFRSFIKPSQENKVTARSHSVHRINDKDLTNAPLMYELWPKITETRNLDNVDIHIRVSQKFGIKVY